MLLQMALFHPVLWMNNCLPDFLCRKDTSQEVNSLTSVFLCLLRVGRPLRIPFIEGINSFTGLKVPPLLMPSQGKFLLWKIGDLLMG